MSASDASLTFLLRLLGAAELAAVVFVVAPLGWMEAVHDRVLGLGPLPTGRIVEYLARHLSALYAVHGAMVVAVSLDVRRYRPLARVLGWSHVGLGVAVGWTDWSAGFAWWWALGEGALVSMCGGAIVLLARQRRAARAVECGAEV
ncbi:hypothetical protein [Urbifossiella limnaea]|uniref:Transmembrane protein n=1 Tax=Urbifossiella limnaea TaxID=2528023 RepID=A0A517XU97_9BACT|nr:hypothetical protein [Urbifossiella limnaea]QDU21082.1 hypothetical protein ETAA1_30470 [Urbifossiella limnaea]